MDNKLLIGIDFETKSDIDIDRGAVNYFNGKDAAILFLSYKIGNAPTEQWHPGDDLPRFMTVPKEYIFYAFNALFEYRAWNLLGIGLGFGEMKLEYMIDVMALCGRFTYHQQLAQAGEDLDLKVKKNPRGKELIKMICCPPYEYSHSDYFEFMQYGKTDVDTMYEMLYALPATQLTSYEQRVWEMTQRINLRGIPVDIESVKQILKVTEAYKIEQNTLLPKLTKNNVTKATQTQRIRRWLEKQGVFTPNLQAKTVEDLLKQDLPDEVKAVLQLRQELGRSSTAKYAKLVELEYNGRVYDNIRYYGSNTGRFAGMGFQLLNLPRSKVTDAGPIIAAFFDLSIIEDDPIKAAKSIVRSMIKAPPKRKILAADYTGIENRGLAWVTEDQKTLDLFRKGLDQYIDMAAERFHVPYDQVTEEQRQFGKMLILGCGYGLGAPGFIKNAATWGVEISETEAALAVRAYRLRYYKVVEFWYNCRDAAVNAISNPGISFKVTYCTFTKVIDKNKTPWLQLTLPSGRNLYYNKPELGEGRFGVEVTAMGINPYSKKWQRLNISPGRFTENIVQGLARDVLTDGKLALESKNYYIIGSVHDEPILEIDEPKDEADAKRILEDVYTCMCNNSPWAKGLPLEAKGMILDRYRKM